MLDRAAEEVDAANEALVHLNEGALTSLDDDRKAARLIKAHFGGVRDALLRMHWWNFAERQQTLAQDPSAQPVRFSKGYPLPPDCMRVNEVRGAEANSWSVSSATIAPNGAEAEVNILSTDMTAPTIIYNRRVTRVSLWDPIFLQCFGLLMAAKIGGGFGRDKGELQGWADDARRLLPTGRRVDEREASRRAPPVAIPHIMVRR